MSNSPNDPSGPLFREQAVQHQLRRLDGEVMLSLSLRMRVLIVLAAILILGAGGFLATASYARMETVSGWIVPRDGLIRVTAQQGGIVDSLTVAEGDTVASGTALATLRLSSVTDAGDTGQALARHLEAQAEAARAEAAATREKLLAEEDRLRDQRVALLRERDESRQRLAAMEERLELVRINTERMQDIAGRGFASTRAVEEAEISGLVAQQDAAEIRMLVLSLDREIGELDSRLQALPLDIRAADAQARANEAALDQRRTELAVQTDYRATATVRGKVVAIPVAIGQSVSAGAVVAVMTPADSRLEAELYVPSRAAGFIRVGNETRLMYQAFPYQKFGTARGRIREVSRTVLAPGELAIQGMTFQEPVFRVKVELDRDEVDAYGELIPVQPGMLLSANIVTDRRSLLEWLFDPIYAVGRQG
ncbi:MAG: HlyD family efflux transporter periplasmic adaptor subunit [Paracoccus denitrificans]|uniref:HlyD family efflux transporter periplasmic adaptor subunit n=1 Tax=Paracoccus denitrificans TaxID=266 RepID=A0A533I7J6_PARDE|nr:MAG: HlyD family efflux transporter periplasmic adaptor subunit [Paracoccus denitrificans]